MTALVEAVVPVLPLAWRLGTLRLILESQEARDGLSLAIEKL